MGIRSEAKWTWPRLPETDAEFEAMVSNLDQHLAERGIVPNNRSFMASIQSANLVGAHTGMRPVPLFGDATHPLLGRIKQWFDQVYGQRTSPHFEARCVAVNLRGTIWRIDIPVVFGSINVYADRKWGRDDPSVRSPEINVVRCLRSFTPFYAARLTDAELGHICDTFLRGAAAIHAFDGLADHALFDAARLDYAHSVDALASGIGWDKARWDNAQTAEKVMKGLMSVAKVNFPTGADGHKLKKVAKAFSDGLGVALPEDLIETIDCRPGARYGEENATREQAMASHLALLELLPLLSGDV